MADNVTIPTTGTGTATPVIATDDVSSVHYQKIKIALGADGAVDTLLDSGQQLAASSVPVVLASDHPDIKITLDGEQVVISGTVQVQSNSANLATEATAAAIQAAVELLDTAVSEGAINVGITAGGPLGFAAEPEATGDGNIIGILKRLRTLLSGTLAISASSLPLPTGAATAANQATANSTLNNMLASLGYIQPDTVTIATETSNSASRLAIMSDWDESDRAKVNLIVAEAGITGGPGTVESGTPRVTLASNDPAVALLTALTGALASVGTDTLTIAEPLQTQSNGADIATEATAAAIKTAVEVVDDWDESDRAKVNLIPGQAGVSAGAGTVAANTPRVTLASNDPSIGHLSDIVASVQNMEFSTDLLAATTKREDDPHANNDRGIPALAVRRDTPTHGVSTDGDYAALGVDGNGRLYVTDANATALTELLNALSSYDGDAILTGGDISHDSPDGNKPVKIGHVAKNFDGSAPGTPVAEDDRVNSIADVYGRQYVEITHPAHWTVSADYASAQTNTSIKTAPGAGLKLYITDVIVSNGAIAGNITLLDGSGGTVKLELYPGVNGGLAHSFRTPIALSANTALCITSTTVTTHSVTICGYTAP